MSPAKKTSASTASRPVLLLLDGHSLAYRAYYALKEADLRTTTGQPTGAVQGFTSMLINTLRDEQPTHVAVAFDVSRQTFRTEKFPEYKANRSASPDDFKSQIGLIDELLAGLGITVIRKEGFEADDVIATLTTQAAAEGYEVRILTGDRDSLQLVTEDVTVLYPKRGVSDLSRFTPAAVQEKYELTPQQYPDFAALRGDPSDNLPNIPGVGEKTAAKWIREFGSLTELVARAEEVKGKAGETLRAHLEQVRLNRELTELIKDVPLPSAPPDLAWASEGDPEAVYQLFDTLEFSKSMRDRVAPLLASSAEESPVGEVVELQGQVLEVGQLADWLAANASGEAATGVAVNGTWGRGTGDVSGLAFASADGTAAYVDVHAAGPGRRDRAGGLAGRPGARRRSCTTPRARAWPWPRAGSRWPAWSPTPRWRRTWRSPAAAPSSWSRWPRRCWAAACPAGADADQGTLFEAEVPRTPRPSGRWPPRTRCWTWPTRCARSSPRPAPSSC